MAASPYATGWDTVNRRGAPEASTSGVTPTAGRIRDEGAWGGYAGTARLDEHGKLIADTEEGGRGEDVARYEGMAQAAAARQAYQNDYSAANQYRGYGAQAGQMQGDANSIAYGTAQNGSAATQQLQQQMMGQGMQAQTAAALSARGGSLSQAAALRQAAAGQGAYAQQAANQMEATRAAEMAQGREQYMQGTTQQRGMDYQGAQLAQQQALAQQQNELQQRQLNQQGEQGYQDMGYATNAAAADAAMREQEVGVGIYNTNSQNDSASRARDMRLAGAGVSAFGTALSMSDVRTKTGVRSLAHAAAMRRAR